MRNRHASKPLDEIFVFTKFGPIVEFWKSFLDETFNDYFIDYDNFFIKRDRLFGTLKLSIIVVYECIILWHRQMLRNTDVY